MGLGYISVRVAPAFEDIISRHVSYAGVQPLKSGDYHATLMYDKRRSLDKPLTFIDPSKQFLGTITGIKEMGIRNGRVIKAMALEIASGDLAEEFERLKRVGYEHSYPEFVPHVSLAYDLDYYAADRLRRQLRNLIGHQIIFHQEAISEVKEGF